MYSRRRNGFKRRFGRRKFYNKKKVSKKLRTVIRREATRVVNRNVETKYINSFAENVQLNHNTWTEVLHQNFALTQGVGDASNSSALRVGNSIRAKFLKIKLWLSNKLDRNDIYYRILIVKYPPGLTASGLLSLNPVLAPIGTGGSFNNLMFPANSDAFDIVLDRTIHVQNDSGIRTLGDGSMGETHRMWQHKIRLFNKKIEYHDAGSTIVKQMQDNYSIWIMAYDAYGTLISDNIASMSRLVVGAFKDA